MPYQKVTYETGFLIPNCEKLLDLPGEQHFLIHRSQIAEIYRASNAFGGLSKKSYRQCQLLIDLLHSFCNLGKDQHGLAGSGALHSMLSTSDFDWIVYGWMPFSVEVCVATLDDFTHELTFDLAHVYRKYRVFGGLSRKDLRVLFEDRWKYFRFRNLHISINFVDPLMRADDFLSSFRLGRRVISRGMVADGVSSYYMPYVIPVSCDKKDRLLFSWLFLYNGAFQRGDMVEFSGRECTLRGTQYVLIETPQDYIRKLTGRKKSKMLPPLKQVKVVLAKKGDTSRLISFLSSPEIDQSFVYPLSRREVSIKERVCGMFPHGFWLIASYAERIVGCRGCKGIVDQEDRIVEFSTIAIDPAFRGIGLGSRLLRKAIQVALERYVPLIIKFDSWTTNRAMERAALKAGFMKRRVFDDPAKRPFGVKSVEYVLDCSSLYPPQAAKE